MDGGSDRALLELPSAGLRVWAAHPSIRVHSGQPVSIGIRSEELRLLKEPVSGALSGTVSRVIDEVSSCTVIFRPDAAGTSPKIQVTTMKNGPLFSAGDRCWLQVPEDRLMVMPADEALHR